MLRKFIVPIIGRKNYINHVIFISQLYRSFLPFRNRAKIIIKNTVTGIRYILRQGYKAYIPTREGTLIYA